MNLIYIPPPLLILDNANAQCLDCGDRTVIPAGTIEINKESYLWKTDVALMSGELLGHCSEHHKTYKGKLGRKHERFKIACNDMAIGNITASTETIEVGIRHLNSEIDTQLREYAETAKRSKEGG